MKQDLVPDGMVIKTKRHVGGKNNHKLKLLHGHLRSVHDGPLHTTVARCSHRNYVTIIIDNDYTYKCQCGGWRK